MEPEEAWACEEGAGDTTGTEQSQRSAKWLPSSPAPSVQGPQEFLLCEKKRPLKVYMPWVRKGDTMRTSFQIIAKRQMHNVISF